VKKKIQITNIVAKSHLVPPFSLSSLATEFPFTAQSALPHIPLSYQHSKFSIFKTGTVISRASRSVPDLESSLKWLSSRLCDFDLCLSDNYEILNIVAYSQLLPFPVNLSPLAELLPHSSYDPSPILSDGCEHLVDAITTYLSPLDHNSKPHRTALIFATGKATLTGFKSIHDLELHASRLSSLLTQISHEHPEVIGGSK
jgi:TATA-box binding protein (TBP) (component of TFIID and TFIIIB)